MAAKSSQLITPGKWYSVFDESGNCIETVFDKSFRNLLGYESEEEFTASLETWTDSIHPDDRARMEACLAKGIARHPEGMDIDIEFRMMTKWGYRWLHDYAYCTRREDGSLLRCDGIVLDIQEIKDAGLQQEHDNLRKEILDYIVSHGDEDPIELLKAFGERIRVLIDCDQFIYRDLTQTRIMVNSPAIEKTWSVPESYCRQCRHFDAHHPMYAGGFTEMENCQEGWQGIPVYHKCPIKSSLTRIVYCDGEIAGYLAIHYVQRYHKFTDLERKTVEEFVNNFSLVLSRYESNKKVEELKKIEDQKAIELVQNNQRILALEDKFESLYDVDLESCQYEVLIKGQTFGDIINRLVNQNDFFGDTRKNVAKVIFPEDREYVLSVMSPDYIRQALEKTNHFDCFYRLLVAGKPLWTKMRVLYKDTTKSHIIIGVFNAEEEMAIKVQNEKAALKNEELIKSFAKQYIAAYYGNLADGSYKILTRKDNIISIIAGTSTIYDAIRTFAEASVHPDDIGLFRKDFYSKEDLEAKLEVGESYEFEYRSRNYGDYRWFRAIFRRFNEDEVLVGFKDCHNEVLEKQAKDILLEEYDAIYIINADKNLIRPARPSRVSAIGNFRDTLQYDLVAKEFADSVAPQYKQDWIRFSDIAFLKQFLSKAGHREFTYELPGPKRTMRRVTFDVVERTNGDASIILMSFVGIDDMTAKAMQLQKQISEQAVFTSYFFEPYESAYYIGLDDLSWKVYKRTDVLEQKYPSFENYADSLGKYINEEVHPDDREMVSILIKPRELKEMLSKTPHIAFNFRNIDNGKNGKERIFRCEAIVGADENHIALGFRDVTEENKREQARQQELLHALDKANEEALRTNLIYEAINAGQWSYGIDSNDGIISANYSNKTTGMVDLEYDTGGPMKWLEHVHPDDKERVESAFVATVKDHTGETTYDQTFRMIGRDRKTTWVKSAGKLFRHEDGTAELIGMTIDITEQIRQQQEQQKQLEEALQMAQSANRAKTIFLNNMSHDIRTPMNAIIGYTSMTQKYIENKEKALDFLTKIGKAGNSLLELINQVLDMSRIESGKVKLSEDPCDIVDRAHEMVEIVGNSARSKNIDLSLNLGNIRDHLVYADAGRMNQLIMNLLGNSVKYTPEGGRIIYSIDQLECRKPGHATYRFTVEDNGIGMSKDYLEKVFEPFSRETTAASYKIQGTGLGMSIVKNLVDLMGGSIEISSELGKGTKIDVTIPFRLQEKSKIAEAQKAQTINTDLLKGKRVLLVEDNEMNREIATMILEEHGLIVETAEDGDIAVTTMTALAKKNDWKHFDFILMDVQMPTMSGYDATKAIRSIHTPDGIHIPIIAMTANAFAEDRQCALEAGMDEHIAKPIDIDQLWYILSKFV